MPAHDVQNELEHLRAAGERLTPQRLLVLQAVRDIGGHVSAEMVLERISARFPTINRATIYRTLSWLTEQGLVSVTDVGGGKLVYEHLTPERHHHLICQVCGSQTTIPDDLIAPMLASVRGRYGFEPRLDHLALFGTCRHCLDMQVAHTPGRGDDCS